MATRRTSRTPAERTPAERTRVQPTLAKPDSERAIKAAALKLFSEKGFYSASTRDIVQAAGVAKGTLYWYWKSKEEIAFSLVADMLNEFLKPIERARDEQGLVTQRFERMSRSVAELYYRETDSLRLLWKFRADRHYIFSQDYIEKVTSYYVRIRQALQGLIEQGVRSGELRKVDAKQMAFILLGIAEGLEVEWLENEEEFSMREAMPEIMRIVISSLAAR
jgi:AcrR family transcriptional regulator